MTTRRIIDADGHVLEPDDVWAKYLPAEHLAYAPRWGLDNEGRPRRIVGAQMQPAFPFPRYDLEPVAGAADPAARLRDMDACGMETAYVYPSAGLHFAAVERDVVVRLLCRAYNDWIRDFCSENPSRLRAAAVVPQVDPQAAVDEARRAVGELGLAAVMLRPNPIRGRTLDDPSFDPLWRTLEELDVPLVLHEATTQNVTEAGRDRYTNYMFLHIITHPHEHQMAMLSLICGRVLERFPGLRVAFVESGCGWVPYWLERMEQHIDYWGHASARLELRPTEYFLRQCFVSPFADERHLPQVIAALGDENLIYTSDYPYPYVGAEAITSALLDRTDLSERSLDRIAATNAMRLYGTRAARS
ncbi:MAG TPA: amidohydrolase family protein [Acidimicrobiales bacterium]|nr:amidohydrolase family protein [Acidimicrobiales bacterium]